MLIFLPERKTMSINNICDVITDEEGQYLYMVSRGRNQFIEKRELPFGCKIECQSHLRLLFSFFSYHRMSHELRFSFGSGEWRDGAAPCP